MTALIESNIWQVKYRKLWKMSLHKKYKKERRQMFPSCNRRAISACFFPVNIFIEIRGEGFLIELVYFVIQEIESSTTRYTLTIPQPTRTCILRLIKNRLVTSNCWTAYVTSNSIQPCWLNLHLKITNNIKIQVKVTSQNSGQLHLYSINTLSNTYYKCSM